MEQVPPLSSCIKVAMSRGLCRQVNSVLKSLLSTLTNTQISSGSTTCNNVLQSNQVKRTPQDSINELIISEMNPLVVPVTGVKFKAAFLHG